MSDVRPEMRRALRGLDWDRRLDEARTRRERVMRQRGTSAPLASPEQGSFAGPAPELLDETDTASMQRHGVRPSVVQPSIFSFDTPETVDLPDEEKLSAEDILAAPQTGDDCDDPQPAENPEVILSALPLASDRPAHVGQLPVDRVAQPGPAKMRPVGEETVERRGGSVFGRLAAALVVLGLAAAAVAYFPDVEGRLTDTVEASVPPPVATLPDPAVAPPFVATSIATPDIVMVGAMQVVRPDMFAPMAAVDHPPVVQDPPAPATGPLLAMLAVTQSTAPVRPEPPASTDLRPVPTFADPVPGHSRGVSAGPSSFAVERDDTVPATGTAPATPEAADGDAADPENASSLVVSLAGQDGVEGITVFVRAPDSVAESRLSSVAAILGAAGLETRPAARVDYVVSWSQVRYFHPEDAEAARLIGDALDAEPRDFTAYRPSPARGVIEVYIEGDTLADGAVTPGADPA